VSRGGGEAVQWAGGSDQQCPFSFNQIFLNPFEFETVKDGVLVLNFFKQNMEL
jgi:hypothetical protein